jgi:hypothetical protein
VPVKLAATGDGTLAADVEGGERVEMAGIGLADDPFRAPNANAAPERSPPPRPEPVELDVFTGLPRRRGAPTIFTVPG